MNRTRLVLLGAVVALLVAAGAWIIRPDGDVPADADVYVSIGDSYGAGFRPTPDGKTATTREGFAYLVADRTAAAGRPVALLNFACTGATSTDVLQRDGCARWALGPGAPRYDSVPQADAVLAALQKHAGRVRLVTVVLGGNDVNTCFPPNHDAFTPETQACLDRVLPTLDANLRTLLGRIRGSVGPDVPIVGLTYPDIFLGGYAFGDAPSRNFADASVAMFREGLNPTLRDAYAASGASFLDLTQLTGAYDPLDRTVDRPPYGTIPEPAARVCELTFYCSNKDFHPTPEGHALIADEILRQVPLA